MGSSQCNISFEQLEFAASKKASVNTQSYIPTFTTKLHLWESWLESGNYAHFATLQQNKLRSSTVFVSMIQDLRTEFSSCFGGICFLKNDITLFSRLLPLMYRWTQY